MDLSTASPKYESVFLPSSPGRTWITRFSAKPCQTQNDKPCEVQWGSITSYAFSRSSLLLDSNRDQPWSLDPCSSSSAATWCCGVCLAVLDCWFTWFFSCEVGIAKALMPSLSYDLLQFLLILPWKEKSTQCWFCLHDIVSWSRLQKKLLHWWTNNDKGFGGWQDEWANVELYYFL